MRAWFNSILFSVPFFLSSCRTIPSVHSSQSITPNDHTSFWRVALYDSNGARSAAAFTAASTASVVFARGGASLAHGGLLVPLGTPPAMVDAFVRFKEAEEGEENEKDDLSPPPAPG